MQHPFLSILCVLLTAVDVFADNEVVPKVQGGICEDECGRMVSDFFRQKRIS
jgi:hypothetical protein